MAGRARTKLSRDRRRVDRAVRDAERRTGLQFCVYLGPAEEDARAHAEHLFVQAGLQERPAVLVLVAPNRHRVEVVTAPDVIERLPDPVCAEAVEQMTPYFANKKFADGLVKGLEFLAEAAGPGRLPPGSTDLPNIVGE